MRLPPNATFLAIAIAMSPAADARDAAHAHAVPPAATAPVPEARWATDAPLREGMRGIARIMQGLEDDPVPADAARVREAGTHVGEQVARIVANCRLPPDADAALHPILADLARGGAALAADPADPGALPRMRDALADYARLFDDPGFQAP